MLEKLTFTAYGVSAPGYSPALMGAAEHTFVVSRGQDGVIDNWNCWGRGKEAIDEGARELSKGAALAEWARLIYGNDPTRPTGLMEKVEGVCQNASNRLLVLAGADVSAAGANLYTVLLYGQYGFHLADFVNTVRAAAERVNDEHPGAISDAELQTVLERIADDPSDEAKVLESHFLQALPKTLTSEQKGQLLELFKDFQAKRLTIFNEEWPHREDPGFQTRYADRLAPPFLRCVKDSSGILGPENYQAMFKQLPEQALPYLLTIE